MYSDNETRTDLLGFEDQVAGVCDLVLDPRLLPVTVGVLGDWGSGKSSLLGMVEDALRAKGAIVVPFSPWRTEDYDDAKSALLDAVVAEVDVSMPDDLLDEVRNGVVAKLRSLRRRVRWLRAAGMAAKHVVTVTAPSLDELDALLRDEDGDDDTPSTARMTRDFHADFSDVVRDLGRPVVVLVDDLDRCLPEQVLDVLHAIRLFLSVPGTAFVLATDERVVRDAVRMRYPQAAEVSETDLPQEYLEKIVQFPIRIPPLGAADVESYLNLLVAERYLDVDQLHTLRASAAQLRSQGLTRHAVNVGIARDLVDLPADAEHEFELIARIAAVLGLGLKGNPRQLKRFLNGLELRRALAERRGALADLDVTVLAKLAVLEYSEHRRFQELHEAQQLAGGAPPALAALEAHARPIEPAEGEPETDDAPTGQVQAPAGLLDNWSASPWMTSWLRIDPPLAGVDLTPYFLLARDAVQDTSVQARRLSVDLQALLDGLGSPAGAQRQLAIAEALKLDDARTSQIVDAGIERMGSDQNVAVVLGRSLAAIAAAHGVHAGPVLRSFAALPYTSIPPALPTQLATTLRDAAPTELRVLLQTWTDQPTSPRLSKASQAATKVLDGNV